MTNGSNFNGGFTIWSNCSIHLPSLAHLEPQGGPLWLNRYCVFTSVCHSCRLCFVSLGRKILSKRGSVRRFGGKHNWQNKGGAQGERSDCRRGEVRAKEGRFSEGEGGEVETGETLFTYSIWKTKSSLSVGQSRKKGGRNNNRGWKQIKPVHTNEWNIKSGAQELHNNLQLPLTLRPANWRT